MRKCILFMVILLVCLSLTGCQKPVWQGNEPPLQEAVGSHQEQEQNTEDTQALEQAQAQAQGQEQGQENGQENGWERITVWYHLGEAGEKITNYILAPMGNGQKELLDESGKVILSGFESYDPMLKLIFAERGGKWGLYDHAGNQVTGHIFEDISNPEMPDNYKPNGLVRVKQDGLWGAVDQDGRMIIQPGYDSIDLNYYEEVEPFVRVGKDGKFGYVTYAGKPLVEIRWDAAFMDVLNVPEDIIFVKEGENWGGIRVLNEMAAPVDWSLKPSESVQLSFNNWQYDYQYDFYVHQVKNGETDLSATTKIFFHDYFSHNPTEIRSLPAFALGESPNWNDLTKFVYERVKYGTVSEPHFITKEQFEAAVEKYFGPIAYTHKSSGLLTYADNKYTPQGWSDHGSFIYELTKLEKGKTADGRDKWKAYLTGYYFHELDGVQGEPIASQSKNAQAVWEAMKKEEYKPFSFWEVRDRLAWNDPASILEPSVRWIIEFTVEEPLGEIYFRYLSCERKDL